MKNIYTQNQITKNDIKRFIRIEAKQAGNIMWKTYPVTFGTLPYSLNDESEPS